MKSGPLFARDNVDKDLDIRDQAYFQTTEAEIEFCPICLKPNPTFKVKNLIAAMKCHGLGPDWYSVLQLNQHLSDPSCVYADVIEIFAGSLGSVGSMETRLKDIKNITSN